RSDNYGLQSVPAGNLRSRRYSAKSWAESGSMQRLADVTNRLMSALVPVQKTAAGGEVEQRQTDQYRTDPVKTLVLPEFWRANHASKVESTPELPPFDADRTGFVARNALAHALVDQSPFPSLF